MLIPVLKKAVDGGLAKYIILLWLCTSIVLAGFDYQTIYLNRFNYLMTYIFRFPFAINFVGYFVLGYYVYNEVSIPRRIRMFLYALGFVASVSIVAGTSILSRRAGALVDYFYDYHNIMVVLMSVAIFVFFKYYKGFVYLTSNLKVRKIVMQLSNLSLGVYLVHTLILGQLNLRVFSSLDWSAFVTIPALWLTTVVLSFGVTYILSKLPFVKVLVK